MTPPTELIEAARAAPHDDAPRLVIADWLEEHGDSERAEFIRLQIALARPDPLWERAEADALRRREAQLMVRMDTRAAGVMSRAKVRGTPGQHREWWRGWLVRLASVHPDPARFWGASGYLALVEDLQLTADLDSTEAVEWLSGLANLSFGHIHLMRGGPSEWAEVEPLTRLWGVDSLLIGERGAIPRLLTKRLEAEWQRRAESATPAECLRAAESLCGQVDVGAGIWIHLKKIFSVATQTRHDAMLARLTGLRGVVGRNVRHWGDLAALPGVVAAHGVRADAPLGPDLRELALGQGPLPDFAALPNLRVLDVSLAGPLDGVALASVARCAELRVLRLELPRGPRLDGLTFPRVLDLTLGGREVPDVEALRRTFPAVRWLNGRPLDDASAAGVPPWFERLPTPAADPARPGVEPLAAWREWGEPADDDLLYGPVRLRLERLPAVAPGDEGRALVAVPTAYPPAEWGRVGSVAGGFDLESGDALGRRVYRALWPRDGFALRLVCEYPSLRPGLRRLPARVAESLSTRPEFA